MFKYTVGIVLFSILVCLCTYLTVGKPGPLLYILLSVIVGVFFLLEHKVSKDRAKLYAYAGLVLMIIVSVYALIKGVPFVQALPFYVLSLFMVLKYPLHWLGVLESTKITFHMPSIQLSSNTSKIEQVLTRVFPVYSQIEVKNRVKKIFKTEDVSIIIDGSKILVEKKLPGYFNKVSTFSKNRVSEGVCANIQINPPSLRIEIDGSRIEDPMAVVQYINLLKEWLSDVDTIEEEE